MPCTPAQLNRAAKYRDANREKVRLVEHIYHINNKDKVSAYKKKYYIFKKEWNRLREILLD
jgi:hypothetical protein